MDMYTFLKKIFLISSILFFYYSKSFAQKKLQKDQPNIIFILADDLGYGDVSCYGQQKFSTPNIDKLAAMGVRFTQFYSGSTVCAPARSTFMTGMHTGHGAIRGNVTVLPEGQVPLPDSIITFPMLLQKNGYETAAFGKWSLGFITTSGDPNKKGFDKFYGYNCQTLAHNYYPDHLWNNHDRVDLSGNLKFDSAYSADLIHQKAMDFLKAKHHKPFFLYLPYTLPHADVIAPHDSTYNYYVKKFNEQPAPKPKSSDGEKHHFDEYPHAAFAAMVVRLDKYVGEIMQLLKEKGIEENTLLIFTSDNGPHKENGGDPVFFNSNAGFKGIKRDLYEGGIREPFIVYRKGITKPGSINNAPCILYDMYPTFLQLANINTNTKIDGRSIVPFLSGSKNNIHDFLYWELQEAGGKQAVRIGDWKGVKLNVSTNTGSAVELYNLKMDPFEKNNVAFEYPGIVKKVTQIMQQEHVSNPGWPLLPDEKKNNPGKN